MIRTQILAAALVLGTTLFTTATLAGGGNTSSSPRWSQLDAESFDRAMHMYQDADRTMERTPWTVAQYDKIVENVGIFTREGQLAAVGAVIVALRDRNVEEASDRIAALQSTDGYVLESDIARQVDALSAIVDLLTNQDEGGAMSAPAPGRMPEAGSRTENPVVASTPAPTAVPTTADIPAPTAPDAPSTDLTEVLRRINALEAAAQATASSALAGGTSTDNDMTGTTHDDYNTTRVCYTIEVARYTDRELAEQRVELLRRTYSRARLAIDDTSEESFVVVVGYYPSTEEAAKDLRAVGRTTGKMCRVAETTIAERL